MSGHIGDCGSEHGHEQPDRQMRTPSGTASSSAVSQATQIAFWCVVALVTLAALRWSVSNFKTIPADCSAVVLRFGAISRVSDGGLLLAWPRPFEVVVLVPGPARILEMPVSGLDRDPRARRIDQRELAGNRATSTDNADETDEKANASEPSMAEQWGLSDNGAGPSGKAVPPVQSAAQENGLSDALAGSGYLLTGDNGVAHLTGTVFFRVTDPAAYLLQTERLPATLDQLATAAAVHIGVSRDLDALMVARPELGASRSEAAARERLRGELAAEIQSRVDRLRNRGMALGIEIARVDVQASLPVTSIDAFNQVLTSMQDAQRAVAKAHTTAEATRQRARERADQILRTAEAAASEQVGSAHDETATINSLSGALGVQGDPGLLTRLYRDKMTVILAKAGRVMSIAPRATATLIIPGHSQ